MARDPGLTGVVPFRFECQRCARCCSAGEGHVWLAEGEAEAMARRLGIAPERFEELYVRLVQDPRSGQPRRSLRERREGAGGRCVLLEGKNECSVYEARPAHCRSFPYWDSVLEDAEGFERARATCPGISVEPEPALRERAFARLEALYAELDAFVLRSRAVCIARGVCCVFEDAGHELWSTALEADYAAARHPHPPAPEAPGRCAYHVEGKCTARAGRPLGCRTYFCDTRTTSVLQEAHEHFLGEVRKIEREEGYPAAYARFPALVETRVRADE